MNAAGFISHLQQLGIRLWMDGELLRYSAAPGVMIVPLQRAFGWDVSIISGAISLNIILLGATGPFLTGLMQVIGLKRTARGHYEMQFTPLSKPGEATSPGAPR
jgi:hypothetical protein